MCLLAIWMSSVEKHLFKSFPVFLWVIIVIVVVVIILLLSCRGSLHSGFYFIAASLHPLSL